MQLLLYYDKKKNRKLAYLRASLPFYAMTCYDKLHTSLQRTGSWLPFQKRVCLGLQISRKRKKELIAFTKLFSNEA